MCFRKLQGVEDISIGAQKFSIVNVLLTYKCLLTCFITNNPYLPNSEGESNLGPLVLTIEFRLVANWVR